METARLPLICLGLATAACGVTKQEGEPSCISRCAPEGLWPGACIEEYDRDRDGIIDSRSVRQYDSSCEPVRYEHDDDADGTPETVSVMSREDDGRVVRMMRTSTGGRTSTSTLEYDEGGHLILYELDEESDGIVESRTEYVNDEAGNVLDVKIYEDGVLEHWTVFEYGGDGSLLLQEDHHYSCWEWSVFTGETVAVRRTYTYDTDGNLVLMELDEEDCDVADGLVDERTETTYGIHGRWISVTVDREEPGSDGPDGVPEYCYTHHYDERGLLVRSETDGFFGPVHGCDGIPGSVKYYSYDDAGRLIEELTDGDLSWDLDGEMDHIIRFEYDACGNRVEQLSDWHSSTYGWKYGRRTWSYGCWN